MGGYGGETHSLGPFGAWLGFVLGLSGWGYILFEIFAGEAGSIAGGGGVNKYMASSFKTMRFIVTVGWSIYPLGYFFGYLMGSVEACILNLVYNLADLVNKIAFCLAIWACAKTDDENWSTLSEILSRPLGTGLLSADGVAGGFDQEALEEAATKLIGNHTRVLLDICNPQPKTQATLKRVSQGSQAHVDQMLREVARRLLGRRPGTASLQMQVPAGSGKQAWKD